MELEKSLDDLEEAFKRAHLGTDGNNNNKQHELHQPPVLMVSMDVSGVSTAAMLWKNVTASAAAAAAASSKKIITTAALLKRLFQMSTHSLCHEKNANADMGALRCALNHALSSPSSVQQSAVNPLNAAAAPLNSLDLHHAVLVDRAEDRHEVRRGAAARGGLRLLFGLPQPTLQRVDANVRNSFRYKQGDFAELFQSCFSAVGEENCAALLEAAKTESHALNDYGVLKDDSEVPTKLRPEL